MAKYQQYEEYKEVDVEWANAIPVHWKTASLSKLFMIKAGGDLQVNLFSDTKSEEYQYPIYTNANDSKAIYGYTKKPNFPANSITVSGRGEVGFAVYRNHEFDAIIRLLVLIPLVNCDGRYFSHFINEVIDFNVQSSAIGQLSTLQISPYKVAIPSYQEQNLISDYLDHETAQIDTLIDKQQTLIQLLKEKRQAVISHAVTKGLNPDAPMKDSGVEWLGEVPEHWEVSKLKYLISEPLQYGANEAAEDIDPTQPRFVRITDVLPNGDLKDDTFRSLPKDIAEPYMLKDGDVLLARSGGTVGKSFIYRDSWGKCCFAGYLIKAKIDKNITPAEWFYLNTLTDFYWKWIESIQIQATIQNVSADKYNSFVIAVPPLEESYTIISYIKSNLEVFDTLVMKAEQTIQLMQERRTALISAAVTGKIDVRGWRASE